MALGNLFETSSNPARPPPQAKLRLGATCWQQGPRGGSAVSPGHLSPPPRPLPAARGHTQSLERLFLKGLLVDSARCGLGVSRAGEVPCRSPGRWWESRGLRCPGCFPDLAGGALCSCPGSAGGQEFLSALPGGESTNQVPRTVWGMVPPEPVTDAPQAWPSHSLLREQAGAAGGWCLSVCVCGAGGGDHDEEGATGFPSPSSASHPRGPQQLQSAPPPREPG